MMMGLCVTVNAAESDQNYNEIYYTVYNENGEVVDEGIIPRTTNARYHWSPNITLDNGLVYKIFVCPVRMHFMLHQIQQ